MAIQLANYQWELDGLVMGEGCDIDHETGVDPGSYSVRDQDTDGPGDVTRMGRSFLTPGAWQFKWFTNTDSESAALAALQNIATVWRGDKYRDAPGKQAALRYMLNGRTRVIYGQPRDFSAPLDETFHSGLIKITAGFKRCTPLFFDDTLETSGDIAVGSLASTSTFTVPFTPPIRLSAPAVGSGNHSFTVGGPLPTPAIVEIDGPLSNGLVTIDGNAITLVQDIPVGLTLVVDTRPWVMAAYWKVDGSPASGALSLRTRLNRFMMAPGAHTVVLAGFDPLGSARCRVRWQRAYPSI